MKIFFIALASTVLLLSGCSTDNTANTTEIPLAPTNLTVTLASTTQMNLQWTDNSTNETGFKVQRKTGSSSFTDVASTGQNLTTYSDLGLTPNTSYTYRVYAYNSAGNSLQYANEVTVITNLVPLLITLPVNSVLTTTAICGGYISSDNGSAVTDRGVCWSTTSGPTATLSTKTVDGSGSGNFISHISGLAANTTYYVRAYATNTVGTAYGNEVSFTTSGTQTYSYTPGPNVTDIDGNVYQSIITSCGQTWTTKNLNVSRYRNGDIIPHVIGTPTEWGFLTTAAWCYYDNDPANEPIYGRLYNHYAVVDPRGLAPSGWHVPTNSEWNQLTKCIDPNADTTVCCSNAAGSSLKSTSGWVNNGNGTNSSGFNCLPGGARRGIEGTFDNTGMQGAWWSATGYASNNVSSRYLSIYDSTFHKFYQPRSSGFSVRLVKD